MKEKVVILREAITKITQMLVGKSIEVTQTGIQAFVKPDALGRPVLVNLPYLPDNAPDSLCIAIQGFLDHEVAHILFSDFAALKKAQALGVKNLMNLLEDARIERKMSEKFAGSAYNLGETGKFFLDNFTTPEVEKAAKAGDAAKVQAHLMVPLIRALSGQQVWKEYIANYGPIVADVRAKIEDLAPLMEAMETTDDALKLAVEIKKRMDADSDPSGEGEGEGDSKSTKKSSAKSKSKPKPKPKPKPEPKEEKEEEEGEPDEDAEDESDSEGEGEGKDEGDEEGEGESEAPAGSDEGEEDGEGDPSSSASPGEGEGGDGELSAVSAAMVELEKDEKNSYDEALSRMITSKAVDAAKHSEYLVYSKESDLVEQLKIGGSYNDDMFTSLESKVAHMVGPIQKDLERAISARTKSIYAPGFRSGRLHSSNLARLAMGDDRVFRRKHVSTSKDVAVSLVVDMSGSMSGAKIHTAAASAYALSAVLERIGISHEVICFTTGYDRSGSAHSGLVSASEKLMGRSYTREEPLYMPIIKTFAERISSDTKKRFGWLPNCGSLRNNIDGECIDIAARRLMGRSEAGKIMIVLSDGEPNARGDTGAMKVHLKNTVKAVEASGVNVIGIGVMSEAVRRFYTKSIVIHDIKDLPTQVIKELKALLLK